MTNDVGDISSAERTKNSYFTNFVFERQNIRNTLCPRNMTGRRTTSKVFPVGSIVIFIRLDDVEFSLLDRPRRVRGRNKKKKKKVHTVMRKDRWRGTKTERKTVSVIETFTDSLISLCFFSPSFGANDKSKPSPTDTGNRTSVRRARYRNLRNNITNVQKRRTDGGELLCTTDKSRGFRRQPTATPKGIASVFSTGPLSSLATENGFESDKKTRHV